ncbi:tyrosine-type recombinase/integrase [Umezawaea sp.]|uniref:tyrosine-type recombinase/integrase n=1 Tax=Umezawaea sp. TaxID=1955258 RepID=UPI002ED1671F
MSAATPDRATIDAALLLLKSLGVSAADLVAEPVERAYVPTFAEYVPIVRNVTSPGTLRVYGPYWNRALERWGGRRLDEVTPSDIGALAQYVRANRVVRRNGRGGGNAVEHLIAALRCLYKHAVADGLLTEAQNPAMKVDKPRRKPSTRHGLPDERVADLVEVASRTGDDPALDALMLRFHIETACRRGGLLSLHCKDLDPEQCLVLLHEKADTHRWQPVSPTLMAHLLAHAEKRGGDHGGPLFRHANGSPISKRRYDYLWERLGKHLPWVATQMVTAHWLRHTTLTWVERNFSYAVTRAFAGHVGPGDAGATTTYVRADIQEVATALAALTEEPHPLAKT